MSDEKIYDYPGEQIDVRWDGRLCIHIAECGKASGDLFVGGRQPWCIPNNVSSEEVAEICERCPSGALTYSDKSGKTEQAAAENTIHVANNGPLYLRGDLDIADAADDMEGVNYRAALCRCGKSKIKPFCDNSHIDANFQDFGAIGESGPGMEMKGGKVVVEGIKDGPLHVTGNVSLIAASGRVAWQGNDLWLCRCGESKNKPFCDGSHKDAGFTSD
jgi:CDGSH-type Zn-finger protein/uncharacterized Fe-S cluster protein YjdI